MTTLNWKMALSGALLCTVSGVGYAAPGTLAPLSRLEPQLIRQVEQKVKLPTGRLSYVGWHPARKAYTFLSGQDLAGKPIYHESAAHDFAVRLQPLWNVGGRGAELRFMHAISDRFGDMYIYQQYHEGLPVFGRRIRVTADPDGRVSMASANLRGIPAGFNLSPALEVDEAVTYVEDARGQLVNSVGLSELGIWIHNEEPVLAWHLLLEMENGKLFHFYVDAVEGVIMRAEPDEIPANQPVVAPGVDDWGTAVSVNAYRFESGRFPMNNVPGGLLGFPYATASSLVRKAAKGPYDLLDATRTFSWLYTLDGVNANQMVQNTQADFTAASYGPYISVHTSMGQAVDYYFNTYDRNSYDQQGSAVVSIANIPNYENASWNGSGQYIKFGGSDASFRAFGDDPQIAGHELSHAFTQFTSGLAYADQPGATNEANSDIMGWTMVQEDRFNRTNDPAMFEDWTIGKGISYDLKSPIRDMKNPQLISQIDHMAYYICGGDPHYNSSIPNLAFVRMVQGDAGTNTPVKITPLAPRSSTTGWLNSVVAGSALVYKANTQCLQSDATFLDLWNCLIAAANGNSSYLNTINATFNSLGVCTDGTNSCNATAGATVDSHITNLGTIPDQYLGSYIAPGGDFDGDGNQDLLARHVDATQTDTTKVYSADIFFGVKGGGYSTSPVNVGLTGGNFGQAFALADVNADGLADILLGVENAAGVGKVVIIPGNKNRSVSNTANSVTSNITADLFSYAVGAAGDVNKDGYQDFLVGAPGDSSGVGKVYLVQGGSSLSALKMVALPTPAGEKGFGSWVTGVGDINGDGYADTVGMGTLGSDGTGGKGRLFLGAASSIGAAGSDLNPGSRAFQVGDLNKDGLADFVIGNTTVIINSNSNVGQAYVYYGTRTPAATLTPNVTFSGKNANEYFGRFAGGADLNNDGYSDLFVTHFETPYARKGLVEAYLGTANGVSTTSSRQWVGSYGTASFGYGIVKRRDVGETADRLVISSPGYLPWDSTNQCRTEWSGALYVYTGADLK